MHAVRIKMFGLSLIAAALSACGGGGGGGSVTSVSGRVVDGYIGGAIVCVDENNNWQCDAGEISTRTDVNGSYTLPYTGSLDGKQILSEVPVGATDSDFPGETIAKPFSLVSPAESASRTGTNAEVILTPFTTMVAKEMMITNATATDAAAVVKAEFGLAQSPLNYDFKEKGDTKALEAAQVITSAIAVVQERVTQAAQTSGQTLSAGQAAIAASKIVKQEVAPVLVKSDGTLAVSGCGAGGCTQAALANKVNTAAASVVSEASISGRIQTIVAGTKSGTGTVTDFKEVVTRGLVILNIDTSDFLYGSGNDLLRVNGYWNGYQNQITAEYLELANNQLSTVGRKVYFESDKAFKVADFSTDRSRIPNPRDITVQRGWYPTWDNVDNVTYWSRESNSWGERIEADGLESPTEVDRNCVKLTGEGSGVFKACLVEKELTGRPLGEVFPDACRDGSSLIAGCDPASPMPAGSFGYNLGLEAGSDNYEFWASAEWEGYNYSGKNWNDPASSAAPSLDRFIEATSSDNGRQYKASCQIAFKINKATATTGTFSWAYNKDASCANTGDELTWTFSEETDYVIKTVAGKEVMEVFVPNVYRAARPGDMVANCKFAFAVVNRPVLKAGKSPYSMNVADYELPATPLPGVYNGEFCPANVKAVFEFTGNLNASGQFMSRAAAEHLASQRGMTLEGLIPER
jgi:hypothetical protein